MKKIICLSMILCLLFAFYSCNGADGAFAKLNAEAEETFSEEFLQNETYDAAYRDFSYRFFQNVTSGEQQNLCISPLSAYMAFSLCCYGAEGVTAEEFAETFGLTKTQAAEYCQSLYARFLQRQYTEKTTRVNLANSVWINTDDASHIKQSYLTGATNYFDASVFKCDFSDRKTVNSINKWCSENTDSLIKKIIDRLDKGQFMALINALLVEAAWVDPYASVNNVREVFNNANGSKTTVEYLRRTINRCYLTKDAKAFKMPLHDGFSFVGILPNENVSISEYCASLNAQKIRELFAYGTSSYDVYTRIPKFSHDYDLDLVKTMKSMGLKTAFSPESADFKGLADFPGENVYVSTAKQKTHFELDENGIKAAAITYIGYGKSSAPVPREDIFIYLDRPFVYLLVDEATNLPLFIGRVSNL